MTTTPTTTTVDALIEQAARHLTTAADLAERHGTPAAEALAAQILLVRALLTPVPEDLAPPTPDRRPADQGTVTGHLHAALAALDLIEPLDGPADLPLTSWHIAELARLTRRTGWAW